MTAEAQTGIRFRIRHADGRNEVVLVDAERALIGSAPYCEVRLAAELVAHEHVEVVASGGLVHVTARSSQPLPLLDGTVLTTALWPAGAVLAIGAIRLTAELVDLASRKRGTSPLWLLVIVPVVAGGATLFFAQRGVGGEAQLPTAPPLFDSPLAGCPVTDREQSAALAEERLRSASSKRERRPFAPKEGVDAVALFEAAGRCFSVAGNEDEARDALATAESLRQGLEDEYKVRRVRLEHAYRVRDARGAKRELRVLIPLTSHRRGPYVEWLSLLNRYADLELEQRSTTRLGK